MPLITPSAVRDERLAACRACPFGQRVGKPKPVACRICGKDSQADESNPRCAHCGVTVHVKPRPLRCTKCGCWVFAKTMVASETCPAGRWSTPPTGATR